MRSYLLILAAAGAIATALSIHAQPTSGIPTLDGAAQHQWARKHGVDLQIVENVIGTYEQVTQMKKTLEGNRPAMLLYNTMIARLGRQILPNSFNDLRFAILARQLPSDLDALFEDAERVYELGSAERVEEQNLSVAYSAIMTADLAHQRAANARLRVMGYDASLETAQDTLDTQAVAARATTEGNELAIQQLELDAALLRMMANQELRRLHGEAAFKNFLSN